MMEITLPAIIENVEKVTDFVNAELDKINCPAKTKAEIDVAIDELFSNIAKYAYDSKEGNATVKVEVSESQRVADITFIDDGLPFNPLQKADPNVKLDLDEREVGGLGIFMVKKKMDNIEYEYKNNQNILKITKKL